jgi:hypothetical protein
MKPRLSGFSKTGQQLTLRVLYKMFPARLISSRGNIEWPARSPHVNACDFFLWGYQKSKGARKETKDKGGLETEHQV